jgi:hypothetical protein
LKKTLVLLLSVFLLSPSPAMAQKRRRASSQRPKVSKPTPLELENAARSERTAASQRVSAQIKSLSQFLYVLGGVIKGIEAAERAAQGPNVPPDALAQTEKSKTSVKDSIRNVRAGLEQLEAELSGKPAIRPYVHRFLGASEIARTAEQQADAGQFDQAGRTLLRVVDKLSDGLAAMQVPAPSRTTAPNTHRSALISTSSTSCPTECTRRSTVRAMTPGSAQRGRG